MSKKFFGKGLFTVLAVVLAVLVLGGNNKAYAESFEDMYDYEISDGTLTVRVSETAQKKILYGNLPLKNIGESENEDYSEIVIDGSFEGIRQLTGNNIGDIDTIVIEEGVKSIGNGAFMSFASLRVITIPSTVESIGINAFAECNALSEIDICNVKSIGEGAFLHCDELKQITGQKKVETIGNHAFSSCPLIADDDLAYIISSSLTSIGSNAFFQCKKISAVSIPQSVTDIGLQAFSGCINLQSVTFAENSLITAIANDTFNGCSSLKSITLPSKVTSLGDRAFAKCTGLESCTFNDKLATIGEQALAGCSALVSVSLPSGVKSIGKECFQTCSKLSTLTIGEGTEELEIGSLFVSGCEKLNTVTIPKRATGIDPEAFFYCSNIGKLNIPYDIAGLLDLNKVSSGVHMEFPEGDTCSHLQTWKDEYNPAIKAAPTCTEDGVGYYKCRVCGKTMTENTYEIPAIGHLPVEGGRYLKSAATCQNAAEYYYECANCNCKLPESYSDGKPLGHHYKSVVSPATVKNDGLITKACSRCKHVAETQVIPRAYVTTVDSTAYTGKAIKTVKVTDAKGKAISKDFYTVTYKNNKNIGKATATVSFKKNYANASGKATKVSFYIVDKKIIPSNVTKLKVIPGKKQLKVTWKKLTKNADGYEIQYSKDKNFLDGVKKVTVKKASASSNVIKKLTAKTPYYVRIRAYNKEGKVTAYSDKWTTIKKPAKTK